jgi:hypothetical protein
LGDAVGIPVLAVGVLILNLLDALFTLTYLQLQLAEEVNPLMSLAYRGSPVWFVAAKLGLVQLGLLVLFVNRQSHLARFALSGAAVVYSGIVSYHLAFLAKLVFA